MNPADLSLPAISPSLTNKNLPSATAPQKSGKIPIPRIDVEPIYTQLRAALGNSWQDYKTAVNSFVLGNLNQTELAWVLQPLLSNVPTIIASTNASTLPSVPLTQLHNQLIICLFSNITRDAPSSEVASWVVATDKPNTAKNAGAIGASDKAEERLKREIMALHTRDRRRIKQLKTSASSESEGGLQAMQDFKLELSAQTADSNSAGMESRRRYMLPLASETLEFPSLSDMQNRIEAVCSDEGLIASAQVVTQACAEFMEQAAETLVKTVLSELQLHLRSNGAGCIQTGRFKEQLRKESSELERGNLQRSSVGYLPVEIEAQSKREPLGESSLHMALELQSSYIAHNRFLAERTRLNQWPTFDEPPDAWTSTPAIAAIPESDEMVIDSEPMWQGASEPEHTNLLTVLDDCLAMA